MGLAVLINGESGSGKSASLRNFKRNEILVFSLHKTRLPFKGKLNMIVLDDMAYSERYDVIKETMLEFQDKCKVFVIDDCDYLMFFEQQQRSNERGYDKYSEMALKMVDLKKFVGKLKDDVIVYFLNHVEIDKETSKSRAITAGHLIDKQLGTFEALFENVLFCEVKDGQHSFITHSEGNNTAKTAMDMFKETVIDNDLKMVDKVIREYYELNEEEK